MPFCDTHRIFFKSGKCSSCLHEKAKDRAETIKAEQKSEKQRQKAFRKSIEPKKLPKKMSDKQKVKNKEYSEARKEWLIGKKCVVFPEKDATTCHHGKGRIGYADDWARQRGITLLMDKRYWVPASMEGHEYIERNPDTAKREGWSWSRHEILDQDKEKTI